MSRPLVEVHILDGMEFHSVRCPACNGRRYRKGFLCQICNGDGVLVAENGTKARRADIIFWATVIATLVVSVVAILW